MARANMVVFDECGWLDENMMQVYAAFTIVNKDLKLGGDVDIDTMTDIIWKNLNEDNKVSLFVRYIDLATNETETRIVNKNV